MITMVRADSNFPNDMPCSISLNFTIDKITVNFLLTVKQAGNIILRKCPKRVELLAANEGKKIFKNTFGHTWKIKVPE